MGTLMNFVGITFLTTVAMGFLASAGLTHKAASPPLLVNLAAPSFQTAEPKESAAVAQLSDSDRVAMLTEAFRILESEGVKQSFLDGAASVYVVAEGKQLELLKTMKGLSATVLSSSEFSKVQQRQGPKGYIGIGFSSTKPRAITLTLTYAGGVRDADDAFEARRRVMDFEFGKKRKEWELLDMHGANP